MDMVTKGDVSNRLVYLLETDIDEYERIISTISYNFMKRDYLRMINYYYHTNYKYAEEIFLTKIINNNNNEFLSKDIDFMIENKLNKLFKHIEGLYIVSTVKEYKETLIKPKLYYINNIPIQINKEYNTFLDSCNYNLIIDGGNILNSIGKGRVTQESINFIINIINENKVKYKILLILHTKHKKILKQILEQTNINYYLTPYKMNDDIYIINAFIFSKTKSYILSNDKFRDHNYNINKDSRLSNNQFKNILKQQILTYTDTIIDPPQFSNCIQIIDNTIIIPHISNIFIEI